MKRYPERGRVNVMRHGEKGGSTWIPIIDIEITIGNKYQDKKYKRKYNTFRNVYWENNVGGMYNINHTQETRDYPGTDHMINRVPSF